MIKKGGEMLKRVLIYFKDETNVNSLLKYANKLKEIYNIEYDGVYIKDLKKNEILPPTMEGLIVDNSVNNLINEWETIENEISEKIKKKFDEEAKNSNFHVIEGFTTDVLMEKMKGYDLIITGKKKMLSQSTRNALGTHFKPVILVPEMDDYKFENIGVAYDNENRSNKSFFAFNQLFPEIKKYKFISANIDDDMNDFRDYLKISKINYEFIERQKCSYDLIMDEIKGQDMLVMGEMKHFFLYEKLAGKMGLKLLENSKIPVFIS